MPNFLCIEGSLASASNVVNAGNSTPKSGLTSISTKSGYKIRIQILSQQPPLSSAGLAQRRRFGAMKAIRRSLKGDKEAKQPQHLSITPKSAIAIIPPKKVIKALYDYQPEPNHPHELAFNKGDFFHVLSREDDPDWYEACNPSIPTARGLVPVAFFEVIGKTQRQSGASAKSIGDMQESHDSGFSEKGATGPAAHTRMSSIGKGTSPMVYGIVQYDFNAERPDELEAKAGEAIIVIAQSNPEWFVAKPIGRLGGPGLIPVSFIEVKDMATGQTVADPQEAVRRAGVPKVEEWKKMAADYKNSSISLGKLESSQQQITSDMGRMSMSNAGSQPPAQSSNGYQMNQQRSVRGSAPQQTQPYRSSQQQQQQQQQLRLLAPISASLPRYCFDNDMYWYIIECQMEDGRHWELARYYADFYDFQIALLETFPEEAGNKGKPRTLPFMPGPVAHVTDAISNGRRQSLDEYIRKILSMPPHISKCQLVRQLFAPRPGDFEIDPNALGDDYRLSGVSQQSSQNEASYSVSRQSSNSQVNGVGGYGGMYPPGQPSYQRGPPVPPVGGPFLRNEASTLTQTSASSSNKAAHPGGAMKVKVFFQEDIIAVRVPSDISFQQLKDKLRDRLKLNEDIALQYRDEPTNTLRDLDDDNDFETALQQNPKLTVTVNYVS